MSIEKWYQSDDWKTEKHVPVIDCPTKVEAEEMFEITATVGKEVAHPNTTAHHIEWIKVYFMPEGEKFPVEVGEFRFTAHGASAEGADKGSVYTDATATCAMKTAKPGTLVVTSYCNIHGLWKNSAEIKVK